MLIMHPRVLARDLKADVYAIVSRLDTLASMAVANYSRIFVIMENPPMILFMITTQWLQTLKTSFTSTSYQSQC